MIEAISLCKRLDDTVVLDKLNLKVKRGSIYGLIGSNGAGKSTLLNILSGVYRPDGGEAKINGRKIYENNILKGKTAYITDDPFYFNSSTVDEMAAYLNRIYKSFDMDKYREISSMFPIDTKKKINTFSKGMRRQVSIILALSQCPEILLCDESFDGLDPVIRQMVKRLFVSEVASRGMTIVISSHNLRELEDVCDHVGIMNKGKIIIERSLSDLQGNVSKIQIACEGEIPKLPEEFKVLHTSNIGRVHTLIVRGNPEKAVELLTAKEEHAIVDVIPLSLEEIFIYETGGVDYEVKDILF